MASSGEDEGQMGDLTLAFVPNSLWSSNGFKFDDGLMIKATAERNGLTQVPKMTDSSYPADALAKGTFVSSTWFQPKKADAYDGFYRLGGDQIVTYFGSFSAIEDASEIPKLEKCRDIYLTGSSALMAGTVISLATAALF